MKWDELKHKKAKKEDKIQAHIHVISSLALESVCVCLCLPERDHVCEWENTFKISNSSTFLLTGHAIQHHG